MYMVQAALQAQRAALSRKIPTGLYTAKTEDLWKLISTHGPNNHQNSSYIIPFNYPDKDLEAKVTLNFMEMLLSGKNQHQVDYQYYQEFFSCWTPTPQIITKMVELVRAVDPEGRLLEVGAGRGLASRLLRDAGLQVACTDIAGPSPSFTPVEPLSAIQAVVKYREFPTILLAWPPQLGHTGSEMSYQALRAFRGTQVIYIGEPRGCCTATDDFFDELDCKWQLTERLPLPRWPNIADSLYVYRRK
jgi:hypothetical protein